MAGNTSVRAGLARLLARNTDFTACVREHSDASQPASDGGSTDAATPCKRPRQHLPLPDASKSVAVEDAVLGQVEARAASLGVDSGAAAKSLIAAHLTALAATTHHSDSEVSSFTAAIKLFLRRNIVHSAEVAQLLLRDASFLTLPLPALWSLCRAGALSLELLLNSYHERGMSEVLLKQVFNLTRNGRSVADSQDMVGQVLAGLVHFTYELDSAKYSGLCNFSRELLAGLTACVLDEVLGEHGKAGGDGSAARDKKDSILGDSNGDFQIMNIYSLVVGNVQVSTEALDSYLTSQLLQILTYRPDLKLTRVLREQEKWRSTRADAVLSAMLAKVVAGLGYERALDTLELVVAKEEVNWGCVLTFVATVVNCHNNCANILKRMIEDKIRYGCEYQEMESLVVGLVFARHAALEGRHVFPSYSQWFQGLFATETCSPVKEKQQFVFLMTFLSQLVPHEPPYCLRAHVTSQIHVPRGCQEVFRDYSHLAWSRLKDMSEAEGSTTRHADSKAPQVLEEVDAAVRHFERTSRVANSVLEASIFRKPHYHKAFLPALLAPRPLPDVPDAKAKLIEQLFESGKIPANLHTNYIEECQREQDRLLAGVFLEEEETEEAVVEPITELTSVLQQLTQLGERDSNSTKTGEICVLPVLARIAEQLEGMMKAYDSKLLDLVTLEVDVRAFNAKQLPYQIIEKMLEVIEITCVPVNADENPRTKVEWVTQYLSLVSASVTLQTALFCTLMHHSAMAQSELDYRKVQVDGLVLSELSNIEGVFLPCGPRGTQESKGFVHYFLDSLDLSTERSCVAACRLISSWIDWSLMSGSEGEVLASLPPRLTQLYHCLAPRVSVLHAAKGGCEVTPADVHSCLDGRGVPDYCNTYFTRVDDIAKHKGRLKDWILFELVAEWGDVPLGTQLAYLRLRLLEFANNDQQQSEMVADIIFIMLDCSLRERNASVVLLAVQGLGQAGGCLLEEWRRRASHTTHTDAQLINFISLCGSLAPGTFLRGDQLLQLSTCLANIVDQLTVVGQDIVLNLGHTSFLLSSVLHAASHPLAKSVQLAHCLAPLTLPVLYHFPLLKGIFKQHLGVIESHKCLEDFWKLLNSEEMEFGDLIHREWGMKCLSHCLNDESYVENNENVLKNNGLSSNLEASSSNIKTYTVSTKTRIQYFRWLLAYISKQQVYDNVPLYPSEDVLTKLSRRNCKMISACKKELDILLTSTEPSKLMNEIFTDNKENNIILKAIPSACAFVVLLGQLQNQNATKIDYNSLCLLIYCHSMVGQAFDKDEVSSEEEDSSKLDYITELGGRLFTFVSTMSHQMLFKFVKDGNFACDPDLKAAIKYRLEKTNIY